MLDYLENVTTKLRFRAWKPLNERDQEENNIILYLAYRAYLLNFTSAVPGAIALRVQEQICKAASCLLDQTYKLSADDLFKFYALCICNFFDFFLNFRPFFPL